jgi:hypothetical protein
MTSGLMNGGGGSVGAAKISLRLQYYVLLAGVGAVVVVACLKYMPAAAAVAAAGYGSWPGAQGSGLAVATRAGEAAAAAAASERASAARSPVVIFNFGDSNSDTGGMAAASGLNIALPEGRTYFRRPTGRLTDGRLVIDFICESIYRHLLLAICSCHLACLDGLDGYMLLIGKKDGLDGPPLWFSTPV